MICEIHATFMVNGPTRNVDEQTALLEAIASVSEIAPTHGNVDDRKRLPFSLEALAAQPWSKSLWRLKPPKYWGSLDATPQPIGRLLLHYEDIDQDSVETVCRGIARLVERLEPAYAALHFKWVDQTREQIASSMAGFSAQALDYRRYGPPGIFAWTWFGPAFVEMIGMASLQAAGAKQTSWGGASLPLVEDPWVPSFDALSERQLAVDKELRPHGFFGDYSRPLPQKGAQWTPLAGVSKGQSRSFPIAAPDRS